MKALWNILFGDLRQVSSNGSVAMQAARDVNIQSGMTVTETKQVIEAFLEKYRPELRLDARDAAMNAVAEFTQQVDAKTDAAESEIESARFDDPDVWLSINEAARSVARLQRRANPEILADLVVERVKATTDDFEAAVVRQAIEIVVKLSPPQIAAISLLTHLDHMAAIALRTNPFDYALVTNAATKLTASIRDFNAVKELRYLTSIGVLQLGRFAISKPESMTVTAAGVVDYELTGQKKRWMGICRREMNPTDGGNPWHVVPEAIELATLASVYRLDEFEPTSVGLAIAGMNLKAIHPDVSLAQWLSTDA